MNKTKTFLTSVLLLSCSIAVALDSVGVSICNVSGLDAVTHKISATYSTDGSVENAVTAKDSIPTLGQCWYLMVAQGSELFLFLERNGVVDGDPIHWGKFTQATQYNI